MTLGNDIEVSHTPLENNSTTVHIEIPDEKYCFKIFECILPSYQIVNRYGLTDEEIKYYLQYCRNNAHLLLQYAKLGGVENA
jgi:hypothetical protein